MLKASTCKASSIFTPYMHSLNASLAHSFHHEPQTVKAVKTLKASNCKASSHFHTFAVNRDEFELIAYWKCRGSLQ